jgi:EAL domain-containing protein (putative c-di-GMP-specific phosphodiesterase class I)
MTVDLSKTDPSQAAITESKWMLCGFLEQGTPLREIPIDQSPFRIGRRPDINLTLPSKSISKLHAEILVAGDGLFLRDAGSTNGTFVNGQRVMQPVPVGENDRIQFADVEFRIGRRQKAEFGQTIQLPSFESAWTMTQFGRLLDERAVIPFYQPLVRLSDLETRGYEVLARSNVPGLENPLEMFKTASRLSLQAELSELCREVGVEQAYLLPGQPDLFVNTHPDEMIEADLILSLQRLRRAAPTQLLTIEIHEGAITEIDSMRDFRTALKDLNMGLAYDDFGAGQARLLDLVEVPPDVLKFDIKMIRGIHVASAQRQQMLSTLVQMVNDFGIATLAEGIECAEEADTCRQMGFEFAQGFHFGRPAPAATFRADA